MEISHTQCSWAESSQTFKQKWKRTRTDCCQLIMDGIDERKRGREAKRQEKKEAMLNDFK